MNLYSLQTNKPIEVGAVVEYLPGRKGLHLDWVKVTAIKPGEGESVHLRFPDGRTLWTVASDIGARIGNKNRNHLGAGVKSVPAEDLVKDEINRSPTSRSSSQPEIQLLPGEAAAIAKSAQLGFTDIKLKTVLRTVGVNLINISDEEFDAILAGLRMVQTVLSSGFTFQPGIEDIYTNNDAHLGLSVDEIDVLCERLNLGA